MFRSTFFSVVLILWGCPPSAASLGPSSALVATNPKSPAVLIGSDDALDAYLGSGGLLLPHTFNGGAQSRRAVADCLECVWRYTIYCAQDATAVCAHAVTTCPPEQIRYRVRFGRTSEDLQTIGSVCWGSTQPATRVRVADKIHDDALRQVPRLQPGYVPQAHCLTGIPIVVWSGQPTQFRPQPMELAGMRVNIFATPMWQWTWGDSSTQWTSDAGSRSALSGLHHRYRSAGRYHIAVQAVWSASYTIRGFGTYALKDRPIHQFDQMEVNVVDSKTLLVHGNTSH